MSEVEHPSKARSAGIFLVEVLAFLGFYFLFTGQFTKQEFVFGSLTALVAAVASHAVWKSDLTRVRWRWRDFAAGWRLPGYAFADTFEILRILARHLFTRREAGSLIREVDFEGCGDGEENAVRRALAIAYTTTTPRFVVIGIDRERGKLLYHLLEDAPIPEMTKQLGARP